MIDTVCTNHGKKREKIAWTFRLFQNLYTTENPASYLISFSPYDTMCTNHGEKREKYGQAFHFSKPPPPQVDKKIIIVGTWVNSKLIKLCVSRH
jgi:hypothetical protein